MERFSTAAHAARVNGVLDPGSFTPLGGIEPRTTLLAGGGRLEGERVWIAAMDPSRARGAVGVAEAEVLCALFQVARREPRPILLLVDSAGAKVDEGLAALGAFRRLFREALLTRFAPVPMLALLGRSCFGGASMLACVCGLRIYSSQTLLAASGPGVIEALRGKGELDAADPDQVRALMGGDALLVLVTRIDSIPSTRIAGITIARVSCDVWHEAPPCDLQKTRGIGRKKPRWQVRRS
jgi:hypothetical protein